MTNNRTARIAASVVIALAMISSAAAQTTDSKACSQQERSNQTLAEELGQSNGVICPAEVDPGIKATTPEGGNTPIVFPPNSAVGNPNIQLK
jgi:hypothetical protein